MVRDASTSAAHIAEFLVEPETAADLLGRLARGESVASYETQLRTRDGSVRQVLIDGSGLFREGGSCTAASSPATSPASWRREQSARHRVEATSHLKDEFLALLSHELRTPLGAILVWLGLLKQGGFDAAESERALEIIERSARSLERIIEDLLHASRIAAGGLMLHPQLVDFRSVVQVAVDAAAGDAALKGVKLSWTHGTMPVWVRGDPGRLQQAVSNLLSNAIKFTPAGGEVEVYAGHRRAAGAGQSHGHRRGDEPEFLPLAFERFRQQDSTQHARPPRPGARPLRGAPRDRNHGGFVSAESPGPGQGSRFTVLLPLAVDPARHGEPLAARRARARPSPSRRTASPSCWWTTKTTCARPCD